MPLTHENGKMEKEHKAEKEDTLKILHPFIWTELGQVWYFGLPRKKNCLCCVMRGISF